MSTLYASIVSDTRKNEVTSGGRKLMYAHIRGWKVGVLVEAEAGPSDDKDNCIFHIRITGGSSGETYPVTIGRVVLDPGDKPIFQRAKTE